MKSRYRPAWIFTAALTAIIVSSAAWSGPAADGCWDYGDPYKMHYPQLPDPNGWDVACNMFTLADDWQCTETGPVTGIYFWVSWQGDMEGMIQNVHLSIHDNNPVPPSTPSNLLWETDLGPADFTYRWAGDGLQGWMVPGGPISYPDHLSYYQVCCENFMEPPFTQQVGEIYWLDVNIAADMGEIGWKTTTNHFLDAAVYGGFYGWTALEDPYAGGPLDLAFVIAGGTGGGEEPGHCWEYGDSHKMHFPQLPDPDGWDVDCEDFILADDWECTETGPVTGIYFWVSWTNDFEGEILNLHLSIHDNDLSGQYSKPGALLWQTDLTPTDFTYRWAGDGSQGWGRPGETWYRPDHYTYYEICCENFFEPPFTQQVGEVYWLDVRMTAQNGQIGWKTTTNHYMDLAVYWDQQLGDWNFLEDPDTMGPMDFAFVITGGGGGGPQPGHCWYPGDPHKMHFPQLPDPVGWDVDCTGFKLADDWQCTQSGPVTGIYFWVSWESDFEQSIQNVHLSIHDNWVGPPSSPSNLLWAVDLAPGQFTYRAAGDGLQGWMEPPDYLYYDNHMMFYEICCEQFPVLFTQKVDEVYWLDVQIMPNDGLVGWKTTTNHFLDAAVYENTMGGGWIPMEDPYMAGPLDLAFVIAGAPLGEEPEEPAPKDAKWRQRLDTDLGLDIPSYLGTGHWQIVADDFQSDGRPITAIRWWGSYEGYMNGVDGPVPPPQGLEKPHSFWLYWYSDIPADVVTNYSSPGEALLRPPVSYELGQQVTENYYTSILNEVTGGYEHEFVYEVTLIEPWKEQRDVVYWLGIQADYTPWMYEPSNAWGWATAMLDDEWNDDAVLTDPLSMWWEELVYSNLWRSHPYTTNSVNMAFELLSDVVGRRTVKWLQRPDMVLGENMPSYTVTNEPALATLRADDFVSDGRRITDIHWWGSYIGYLTNEPGSGGGVPIPLPDQRPLGFHLSWHHDVPIGAGITNYSMPETPAISNLYVPIKHCYEVYYGTVTQEWKGFEVYDHEFQYYVDLLNTNLSVGPWPEEEGVIYWLNIQAVLPPTWIPEPMMPGWQHSGWGWKTTPWTNKWNDASVESTMEFPGWKPAFYPKDHPNFMMYAPTGYCDLAFELTTDEPGTSRWVTGPIVITEIESDASNEVTVVSQGTTGAGAQYLQHSTNLLTDPWADMPGLWKPLPHASGDNVWHPGLPGATSEFYRVMEK